MSTRQLNRINSTSNIRHNTKPYFIKCPECLRHSKNPQRVKTHKNLSSLDSHYSRDHKGEGWVNQAQIELRKLAREI